jgi:hypothetical protein
MMNNVGAFFFYAVVWSETSTWRPWWATRLELSYAAGEKPNMPPLSADFSLDFPRKDYSASL